MSFNKQRGALLLACLAAMFFAADAQAASMNYGDLMADNVWFRQVEEQNGEPNLLYSAPSTAGDSLEFDPVNFLAQTPDGGGATIVDSQMSMTIEVKDKVNTSITDLSISEAGDFTLIGIPNVEGKVAVGAAFFWTVTEINGVAVTGPSGDRNMMFTSGSGDNGGEFALPDDAGVAQIWTGSVLLDLAGEVGADERITAVRLTFDNTLSATAAAGAAAFIKKKSIGGVVVTPVVIPEPSAILLVLMGIAAIASCRR